MADKSSYFSGQLIYAMRQGFQNILRSPLMSLIVVSTMVIALSTLGFLLLVVSDLNLISTELATQLKIVVFLEDQQDIDRMAADIENLPGVQPPVIKISREEALETMLKDLSDLKDVLKENNPFPATIEVAVTEIQRMEAVGEEIKQLPGVEEVQFNQELAEQLQQVQNGIQLVGSIFSGILILATLAIVINTIQLAVHHRHTEIEIMRLVGAPAWFIRFPFILEGLVFGLVASVIASLTLIFWRLVPYPQIQRWFAFLPLPNTLAPLVWISALLLFTGLVMGSFGSVLSVHRYLRLEQNEEPE